jgi:Fe-S-cluster-containing hydrogenase component 2
VINLLENYPYDYEGQSALDKLSGSNNLRTTNHSEFTNESLLEEIQKFDLFQTCAKCNHCIDNFGCPAMTKVDGKVVIDEKRCTACGLCLDVCPNNAIYVETEVMNG